MPAAETYDGAIRIYWLDTDPANPEAPTVAEVITAGEDLTDYGLPDIDFGVTNGTVPSPDLRTSFDAQSPGRRGAQPKINFKRKLASGGEVAWTTVGDYRVSGALVIFQGIAEDADPVAGDDCIVYTGCKTGEPMPGNVAENAEKRFQVTFYCGGNVYQQASLVA